MKALRNYLTFNVIVAALSGAMFLLFPAQLTAGQGNAITPGALIFVRTVGGLILCVAVLDWYARDLKDRKMMQGVLLVNFLVHAISITVDVVGIMQGVVQGTSEWYNIAFRTLIALGFLYFIVTNPLKTKSE